MPLSALELKRGPSMNICPAAQTKSDAHWGSPGVPDGRDTAGQKGHVLFSVAGSAQSCLQLLHLALGSTDTGS